jgi:chromosomal replication initiation ATPase DnaA
MYEKYILKGIDVETELNFKSGCFNGILSDEKFADDVIEKVNVTQKRKIELSELITKVCERYNLKEENLGMQGKHPKQSQARAMLALLVRELEGLSLESLSQFLKRDASGLSKLASRFESKCSKTAPLAKHLQEMREWVLMSD